MDISCSNDELAFFKLISSVAEQTNTPCYLVGGFVRDKLIGRTTKDIDIVCLGDAIGFANEVANSFSPKPHVSFFKNFGTAQIKLQYLTSSTESNDEMNNIEEIEFASARKESYNYNSRKPEVLPGTLEDDQNRRDFTINALAVSLNNKDFGTLIDPFNGIKDLHNIIIKTPLQPAITFSDDPLRMMRAIRFAAQLDFEIEAETFHAITENHERIKIVSQERITDELNKIMLAKKPSVGWHLLSESGLLEIIFPQMMALHVAEYIDGKGHKDNFYHTLQVIDNISEYSDDLWLRWAALLHDIGKPATKRFEEGHGFTFHGHEVVGARMVSRIFSKLKLPMNEKMKFVQKLVALHLRPISLTKENITDSAVRRLLYEAGEDIDALMLLCHADITSKNRQKVKKYQQNFQLVKERMKDVEEKDHLRSWQPPITGDIIMKTFNLKPCRQVGIIKDAIRDAILDGLIENNYDGAFDFMLQKAAELNLQPVT